MNWQRYEAYNETDHYRPIWYVELDDWTLVIGEFWQLEKPKVALNTNPYSTISTTVVYEDKKLASYIISLETGAESSIDSDHIAITDIESVKVFAVQWLRDYLQSVMNQLT